MKNLLKKFDIEFNNDTLLERALTHSSLEGDNYERLEFLGDRVLGLVIADVLLNEFPDEVEGDLAKRHTALVQGPTVAEMARKLGLGPLIQMSDSERNVGGEENDHILCDVMEAIIGAIYTQFGYRKAAKFILDVWDTAVTELAEPPQDPKTALQEWSQGKGLGLPIYELIGQSGPDHAPIFDIQVSVEGLEPRTASGSNKREAQKSAAQAMLDQLPN